MNRILRNGNAHPEQDYYYLGTRCSGHICGIDQRREKEGRGQPAAGVKRGRFGGGKHAVHESWLFSK